MMDRETIEALAHQATKEPIYPNPLFPPSVYFRFLRLLAAHMQAEISVELGVCGGGGSLHLALGSPSGIVIGVDTENKWPENVAYVIQTCPNFDFWCSVYSVPAASMARTLGIYPVDILFLDTWHTYERVWDEFRAWERLLQPGSVVLVDDLFQPGARQAFEELPGEKVRLDLIHDTGGFGAILL